MNRKSIPLVLMLLAGAVTCIITFVKKYSVIDKLVALLVVLVIFLILGNVLRYTLDYFDKVNEKKALEEGEVIEKENESEEDAESKEDEA
ncbi:MAG: hypothetical protein IJ282_08805 [Lachnospiraceae bacterium]|nr:hypothetical protein [Lachnospiraceae bacterium]